jgi:GTP cyclohydrolase III
MNLFQMVVAQEHFKDDPETLAQIEKIKDKISALRFFFNGENIYLVFNSNIQQAELETLEDTARKVASAATG